MCVVFYTDELHSGNLSVSEPHTQNENVSEPHSGDVNVSEPHSGNVNVTEPTVECCVTVCVKCGLCIGCAYTNVHKLLWWAKLAKRHKM